MSGLDPEPPVHSRTGEPVRLLLVAVQFLTRLPVPPVRVADGDLRSASGAFPLVGLVVGAAGAAVFAVGEALLGGAVAAVLAVATTVAITGALHEDGLADACDGLWGGSDPEQRIAIMRDSRIGTYGVLALVLSVALRIVLLAPLAPLDAVRALLVGHVVARAAILVQIRWLPPASTSGQGAKVGEPIAGIGLVVAALTTLLICGVSLGVSAAAPLAVALLGVGAVRRVARRRLGGLTGDILGATQQVALLLAIGTVTGLVRAGLL